MKYVALPFLSLLFLPIFLGFVVLTSFRFQILNYDFLTRSFEKNQIYSKIPNLVTASLLEQKNQLSRNELASYQLIAKKITPELSKEFINRNLKVLFEFLDGKTKDLVFYIPLRQLGLSLPQGFSESIPMTTIFQGEMQKQVDMLYGSGQKLFIVWVVMLIILVLILTVEYKISKKFVAAELVISGLIISLLGLALKHSMVGMSTDLANGEPSELALGVLTTSILPEIVTSWIIAGIVIVIAALLLFASIATLKVKKKTA